MNRNIIETILKINNYCLSERQKKEILSDLSAKEAEIVISINPEEQISSTDLASRNDLSPSRMSRIVDKLCQKGYCIRHSSEQDRRAIEISLSKTGLEQREILIRHSMACEENLRAHLNPEELKTVQDALDILITSFDRG